jgi:hypothetical protein
MGEIAPCGSDGRLTISGHLNTVEGTVDEAAVAGLLKARG